ncbi:hypothetical protein HY480_02795 [Candidatus Uhrbacteria bacterium]|nr:hypothetical protein [Candidatus Uhrbacteria bacterium]
MQRINIDSGWQVLGEVVGRLFVAAAYIVAIAILISTFTGCVSARYSTGVRSELAGECGAFRAKSSTRGVAVSEAAQNYGTACQSIQMARADAAYVQSLTATAAWYATQDGEAADATARHDINAVADALADHLEDEEDEGGAR